MADSSPKKRKRASEQQNGSESSKKLAIRQQRQQAQEQPQSPPTPPLITMSTSGAICPYPPVLATTPGLVLPEKLEFRSHTTPEATPSSTPARKRKQRPDALPKEIVLHSTSHRSLDYTAREDKLKGTNSFLRHYVGVLDPATGAMRMVEARKMVVRGTVRARAAEDEAMAERTAKENVADMKNELGQAFGTKKAKKAIAAQAENALTPNRNKDGRPQPQQGEADRALVSSIKDSTAEMATREELQAAVDQVRPVPKGNYEADDVQDVYDPREIIGPEILNAIPVRDWQDKARQQEEMRVPSRFVAARVNRVAANERDVDRLRVLRYMLFLLAFFTSSTGGRGRDGVRKVARRDKLREMMAPAPEAVVESIRRKFSDRGEMRKVHVDLLMTHWCVFAAIIDGFDVNTLDVREDLRLEQKQINQYFHEIGARTRQVKKRGEQVGNFAKLALPLQFPRLRQHRQR